MGIEQFITRTFFDGRFRPNLLKILHHRFLNIFAQRGMNSVRGSAHSIRLTFFANFSANKRSIFFRRPLLKDKVRFICFWSAVSMKHQDMTTIYPRALDTLDKWAAIEQSTFMVATSLALVISQDEFANTRQT